MCSGPCSTELLEFVDRVRIPGSDSFLKSIKQHLKFEAQSRCVKHQIGKPDQALARHPIADYRIIDFREIRHVRHEEFDVVSRVDDVREIVREFFFQLEDELSCGNDSAAIAPGDAFERNYSFVIFG